MKTSGLILDVYDDVDGMTLKAAFPSPADIPQSVKVGHSLSFDERNALPDEVFALVLREGDDPPLRKFACTDQGNTELSMLYFIDNGHKLDPEAQQKTAENLLVACDWYGITPLEPIVKAAGIGSFLVNRAAKNPVGTAMTAMTVPSVVKGTAGKAKQNLQNVRQAEINAGGNTAGGFDAFNKHAEVAGTSTQPLSAPGAKGPAQATPVVKSAMSSIYRETPYEAPLQQKQAQRTALADGRYPLDSYGEVKQAAAFFDQFAGRMELEDRREFAVNLYKRACELAINVPDSVAQYGSEKTASAEEWENGYLSRKTNLEGRDDALALLDKVASQREQLDGEKFAALLGQFDEVTGLNHHYDRGVIDPIRSSFTKEATVTIKQIQGINTSDDDFRETVKNTFVTAKHLADFALTRRKEIEGLFGSDFADKFQKDPVGEYKKLHDRRRILIANLVTDNAPGTGVTA